MSKSLDRLSLLATFVRIAERGSISAAARDLGLSQASASRRLSELEDRLNITLVERTTHHLALTEAGQAALLDARHMLDGWAALTERFEDQDALSGTLQVIAPVALGQLHLAELALDWRRDHPGVTLNWRLDDTEINVAQTGCDLWIRAGRPKDDRLIVCELGVVERRVVGAAGFASRLTTRDPHALKDLPGVALAPFEGVSIPMASADGKTARIEMKAVFSTNNIFAALEAVEQGAGYAVMPSWLVADALEDSRIVDLLPNWRAPPLTITACFLPSRRTSRALSAFTDMLSEKLPLVEGIRAV